MPKSLILLLVFPLFSLSQTLTGTVKDSLGNPFQNANVIAKPLDHIIKHYYCLNTVKISPKNRKIIVLNSINLRLVNQKQISNFKNLKNKKNDF